MAYVEVHDPDFFSRDEWMDLQELSRNAHHASIVGRTYEEIEAYLGIGEFDRFYDSHRDPNKEVGRRYNPDQEFTDPRVAVVIEDGEIVSWTYGADNVSGPDKATIEKKRRRVIKNHFWLRESVTLPDYQNRGFASLGIEALTAEKNPLQDARTYWYKREMPYLLKPLLGIGFKILEIRPDVQPNPFGEDSDPAEMVVMRAISARLVSRRLRKRR